MYQINQNFIKTLQWHFQTSSFSIFTEFFLCRAVYSKSEILAQFMLSYTHTHTHTNYPKPPLKTHKTTLIFIYINSPNAVPYNFKWIERN